jgi:hypothetical protein
MATIDLLIQCANRLEKDFPDQLALLPEAKLAALVSSPEWRQLGEWEGPEFIRPLRRALRKGGSGAVVITHNAHVYGFMLVASEKVEPKLPGNLQVVSFDDSQDDKMGRTLSALYDEASASVERERAAKPAADPRRSTDPPRPAARPAANAAQPPAPPPTSDGRLSAAIRSQAEVQPPNRLRAALLVVAFVVSLAALQISRALDEARSQEPKGGIAWRPASLPADIVGPRVVRLGDPLLVGDIPVRSLNETLDDHLVLAESCYESLIATLPADAVPGAALTLKLVIGADGGLSRASIAHGYQGDSRLATCALEAVQGARFPAPSEGSAAAASYVVAFVAPPAPGDAPLKE